MTLDDRETARLIAEAATRYGPAEDLRARVERRATQQRHRRVALATGTGLVVLLAVIGVASTLGDNNDVQLQATNGSSAPAGPHNPINWTTELMTFTADDLRIEAGGRTFLGGDPELPVHHDPGLPDEGMTFERTWQEHGVEMRLYIYFKSDGTDWWSDEIRIYDGASDPEWITFAGTFFRTPLDQEFTGNLDLPDDAEAHDGAGRVVMRGLHLQAFLPPAECSASPGAYVLDLTYPDIQMSEGFSADSRLRDRNCNVISDLSEFRFTYTQEDLTVVEVEHTGCYAEDPEPGCEADVNLIGRKSGKTTLHVTVHRVADDTVVATGTMLVTVTL